ncbi:MAG: hypothetical protein QGG40_03280 [Myxococcota bacterium]|jgi:hypothetical protein|nr:hypothetical protein [Myxococcota bacterium]
MLQPLRSHLSQLRCGTALEQGTLLAIPLFGPDSGPRVRALRKAMENHHARVTEVSERGSVQQVQVENRGPLPLLLFDGEELIGAKQNRIVNTTLLVPAGVRLVIPVSCVESGRWARRTDAFESSTRTLPSSLRARKAGRMMESLRATGTYDAGQHEVWNDVTAYLTSRRVESSTRCLSDALEADHARTQELVDRLAPQVGQVGLAVWIDGQLAGIEVTGRADTWIQIHELVSRCFAHEAIARSGKLAFPSGRARPRRSRRFDLAEIIRNEQGDPSHPEPNRPPDLRLVEDEDVARTPPLQGETDPTDEPTPSPLELLESALTGRATAHQSPGMGSSIQVDTEQLNACALNLDQELIHLSVYPS